MSTGAKSDRRGTWDENSLKQALAAIKSNTLTIHKASQQHGIPARTLRRYRQKNLAVKSKVGSKFTLTQKQNDELVVWLLGLAEKGYSLKTRLLRSYVYQYCEQKGIKTHFSKETRSTSYKWVLRFIKKNPQLANLRYDTNFIAPENLEPICSLNDASSASSPINGQLSPDQDFLRAEAFDESKPAASLSPELSEIPEPELRQHALSLCESLLAEYESNSDEESKQLQIDIKDECMIEDSCNEESLDGDKYESLNGVKEEAEPVLPVSLETSPVKEKRRTSRGRHASWSEDTLREALAAIRAERLTTHQAAKHFDIPRSTLRRYLKANRDTKAKLGTKCTFSDAQNEDFCAQIRQLASRGYAVTTNFLRAFVYKFCEENEIRHSFSQEKKTASYKWMKGFLRKNPELLQYVHKNTVDSNFVPDVDRIPVNVMQVDSNAIMEEASVPRVENQIFINCESPFDSEVEASDGEVSPDEDPLEIKTETKKSYAKWSPVLLEQALKAIKSKEVSTHRAAKIYKIPRSTLRRYLEMEKNGKKNKGHRSTLNEKQNAEVCTELQILANNGIPLTMRTVKSRIFEYCEKHGIKNSFPQHRRLATYKMVSRFLKNNPAIEELMRTQTFDGHHYGSVMILDNNDECKPAFVQCELSVDEDSSSQVQIPITLPAVNEAEALTNGDNAQNGISFPESIGLFEMVSGAYQAS